MTELFDDQLLDEFAHAFYGYGNYGGRYWFVGMEEGGGNSFAEVANRLRAWAKRGRRELEDVAAYHAEVGIKHLFGEAPRLQPTWSMLIRIALSADGLVPTTEQAREYQRVSLGRPGKDTCLVELLPLPSPSTGHWLYAEHSGLPYLHDRESYMRACLAPRTAHLRQLIREHKPRAVVFYGLGYREHWRQIACINWRQEADAYVGQNDASVFMIVKHPAARGVTSEYFHGVGRTLAALLR